MIVRFCQQWLEDFYRRGSTSSLGKQLQARTLEILDAVDAATGISSLAALRCLYHTDGKGGRIWSLNIDRDWFVTFRFEEGDVVDVDVVQDVALALGRSP